MELTHPLRLLVVEVGILGTLRVKIHVGNVRFVGSGVIFLVVLLAPQHLTGLTAQVLVGVLARRVHIVAQSVTS